VLPFSKNISDNQRLEKQDVFFFQKIMRRPNGGLPKFNYIGIFSCMDYINFIYHGHEDYTTISTANVQAQYPQALSPQRSEIPISSKVSSLPS
jgi:hypothetical protein